MLNYAKLSEIIWKYAKLCQTMPNYAKLCRKYATIRQTYICESDLLNFYQFEKKTCPGAPPKQTCCQGHKIDTAIYIYIYTYYDYDMNIYTYKLYVINNELYVYI